MPTSRIWALIKASVKKAFLALGVLMTIMLALAFTRIPFDAHRWLGTAGGFCKAIPDAIVVLGGSGMPSGPELMRCDLAADLARNFTDAQVVLILPEDTALAAAMEQELVTKGVLPGRITAVLHGRNTREQALDLLADSADRLHQHITLVTAPENMYRSLLTFRKAGFAHVCGSPAFDHALFDDLRYAHGRIGGKAYVPDVSNNMDLRYDFWNRLKLEITCMREYTALAYYKLNGWI
ncbi:MAG: YdcF family protein [Flavobacteriales bacterium]